MVEIQNGSILVREDSRIGVVVDEEFNSHPIRREIGDHCWVVRSIEDGNQLVTKSYLTQIGNPCPKWKNTGIRVNPEAYGGLEAFNLEEIKILASGGKLPYIMSKEEFLEWVEKNADFSKRSA